MLKQQKGELTEGDKKSLVDKVMNNIKPLTATDEYTISDLKISDDTGKEAVKNTQNG